MPEMSINTTVLLAIRHDVTERLKTAMKEHKNITLTKGDFGLDNTQWSYVIDPIIRKFGYRYSVTTLDNRKIVFSFTGDGKKIPLSHGYYPPDGMPRENSENYLICNGTYLTLFATQHNTTTERIYDVFCNVMRFAMFS